MIMKKGILSIMVLLLFQSVAIAKGSGGAVSGVVTDEENKPMESVNVVLLKVPGSLLAKAALTDEKGEYNLSATEAGRYVVKATLLGFQPYTSDTLDLNGGDMKMAVIKMMKKNGTLNEVTVRTEKPFIEVKADMIVVNVENSIVNTGSTVMEILQRSPGVIVDQNDNISLKGKQGVTIMIDGKLVPIAGDNLANYLKNMPSTSVEKIELISNPGAKYDAAGTGGIINIRTKRDKRMGLNGSVTASYGQGVHARTNEGFSLNYKSKKINAYASYSFLERKGFNELVLDRKFIEAGSGKVDTEYRQRNNLLLPMRYHNAAIGMDYNISKRTSIGAAVTGTRTRYEPNGTSFSDVYNSDGILTSRFVTINDSKTRLDEYSANLNFKHSFDSMGTELTADVDYARYGYNTSQHFTNEFFDVDEKPTLPNYDLIGYPKGATIIRSFKSDFVHPLKQNMKLEAGVKLSYVTSEDNSQYTIYNYDSARYVNDPTKTNHFIYTENINAGYFNFSQDRTKWSYQLGLRAEQTVVKGEQKAAPASVFNRNYVQLFPSLAAQWHMNQAHDLGVTLSRRIDRPNYEQLNPFKFFLDPSNYKVGNPNLQPALTYSVELSHTYKQRFVTSANYSITENAITEVIQPSETIKNESIQTNKNIHRQTSVSFNIAYPFQIFKWWSNVTSGSYYYNYFDGDVAGTPLHNGRPAFYFNTTNNFLLPKDLSAELSMFYQSDMLYGYMTLKPLWSLNAGLQKNLFKNKASVKLAVTDIFWKVNPVGLTAFSNYNETFIVKRDTRVASIVFTYRFGNRGVGQVKKNTGGAEEEKRRAQSSAG
jgi:outer membrane receptor protein involved in Fe transport